MLSHGSRVSASISLGVIAWVLVLSASYYIQPFFGRASTPPEVGRAELERLDCLEQAVTSLTAAGESVRLLVTNGDVYLRQRVAELVYPRVNLVLDESAPVLTISVEPDVETGATRCGDAGVTLDRER